MNRRGVLCEEVYHVLQFPSPALSVSGNMGIISACGTYCIGTWQAPLCIRGTKIRKVRELYKWKKRRESLRGGFDSTIFHQLCCNYLLWIYLCLFVIQQWCTNCSSSSSKERTSCLPYLPDGHSGWLSYSLFRQPDTGCGPEEAELRQTVGRV